MSFVRFEQLPNILKKAIYEKSKFAYFFRKQRENEFFFPRKLDRKLFLI